jgi:phage regulator Rha-like protein
VTLKRGQNIKYLPYAFTEHGAIMAANVLNSPRAVQMSVFVVRAFLKMRALLGDKRDLAQKLAALEKTKKATRCPRSCYRYDLATRHGYHRSSGPPSSAG